MDYTLNLPNTYRELFEILDKYDLINTYDEEVADFEDLSQKDLCNIMKAIIKKNNRICK